MCKHSSVMTPDTCSICKGLKPLPNSDVSGYSRATNKRWDVTGVCDEISDKRFATRLCTGFRLQRFGCFDE